MNVLIEVPTRAQIVNAGFEVQVAPKGHQWKKAQLGDYADKKGVYIHHSNGKILYVGNTTRGEYGTFGERLRREFHEGAASSSPLHQMLSVQTAPTRTYLLDLLDLDMMVNPGPRSLTPERKALIMEQVLIGIYDPEGNRR